MPRVFFWAAYTAFGLVLQQQFPGLDALAPGFLIALQQGVFSQTAWLFLIFTLIQEGSGSLHFGMGMLWYGGQIFLFHLSSRLFVAENFLFVSMLSASLGAYYCLLIWFMCALQDVPLNYPNLIQQGVFQAVAIPLIWGITWLFTPKGMSHAAH